MGAKEDESSTGHVWATGFHHVTARSRLAHILETYEPFISLIFKYFLGRSKPRVSETTDSKSADTEARLYFNFLN
jgi:hypothetical protein